MEVRDVTLVMVGDIFVQQENPSSVFRHVDHLLRKADIALGNQEVSLSAKNTPMIPGRNILRSDSEMVQALTSAGFNVVGLANNHSMDCGIEGIMETIEVLDQAKIAHAGAGADIKEAHKPAVIECNGTKVAFLAYSSVFIPDVFPAQEDRPGIATVKLYTSYLPHRRVFEAPASPATAIAIPEQGDLRRLQWDIANARAKADIVVVSWHWGLSEGYGNVVDYQREMGKFALNAGANIVVGHHPHVLQGVEVYKGMAIFYSLGNFSFHEQSANAGKESVIIHCQIKDKKIHGISFLPIFINERDEPEVASGKKGKEIFQLMKQLSAPFGTTMEYDNGEVTIGNVSLHGKSRTNKR